MAGETIQIDGLKRTVRDLKTLDKELVKEVKALNRKAAETVSIAAQAFVPRRSGRLARSIRPGATTFSGIVRAGGNGVPYGPPIHWGWYRRHIKPQPFLYEALDSRRGEVEETYKRQLASLVEHSMTTGAD